jgi:hypothetical protein
MDEVYAAYREDEESVEADENKKNSGMQNERGVSENGRIKTP